MTADTFSSVFTTASETVLSAIQSMSDKQRIKKPICLDSVALVLKLRLPDLKPIIKHLESEGHITVHLNLGQRTNISKPDSISLN